VKQPRIYALEILQERSRERRLELLSSVPEHLQPLVKKHVEIAYESNKRLRKVNKSRP